MQRSTGLTITPVATDWPARTMTPCSTTTFTCGRTASPVGINDVALVELTAEQLGVAAQTGQWRFQLMSGDGQKLVANTDRDARLAVQPRIVDSECAASGQVLGQAEIGDAVGRSGRRCWALSS